MVSLVPDQPSDPLAHRHLRTRLGPIVLGLWIVSLAILYFIRNQAQGFDDSFITYRYADNLRRGAGLAFNPGERHYGSTAMGFAIALAWTSEALELLTRRSVPIHVLAHGFSAASLAALGWGAHRLLRRLVPSRPVAFAAAAAIALFLFSAPGANSAVGHETYPFIALLATGAYRVFFLRAHVSGAACLAIASLLRPDGALFLLLTVALLAGRQLIWRDVGWPALARVVGVLALVGGVWLVFTTVYFGSPLPETLAAKRAQVLLGHWYVFTLPRALRELHELVPKTPAALFLLALAEVGVLTVSAIRAPASLPPVDRSVLTWSLAWILFGGGLLLVYRELRVTFWGWYVLPVYFAILLTTVAAVPRAAMRRSRAAWVALALVLAVVAFDGPRLARVGVAWAHGRPPNPHLAAYDSIITFLQEREPGGTTLATAEPGHLGYRLGPRYLVVDELGLASPGVARRLLAGDFDYPFVRWKPEYLIVSYTGRFSPEDRWWFGRAYRFLGEFKHPHWQADLKHGAWLYQRVADPAVVIASAPDDTP